MTSENLRQGRVVVLVGGIPFKCPAAPYEAAMLLNAELHKHGVSVDLYTPEPGPMPAAGPQVSAMVRQMVESTGVRVHTPLTYGSVTNRRSEQPSWPYPQPSPSSRPARTPIGA